MLGVTVGFGSSLDPRDGPCKTPQLMGERRIQGPRPASCTEARPESPLATGIDTAARLEIADSFGSGRYGPVHAR